MRTAIVLTLLAASLAGAHDTPSLFFTADAPPVGVVDIRLIPRLTASVFSKNIDVTYTIGASEKTLRHFKLSRIDVRNGHLVKLVSPSVEGFTQITATKLCLGLDGDRQVIATADAVHVILQIGNIKMQVREAEFDLETSKLRLTGECVSIGRYVLPEQHSESANESSESLPSATDSAPKGE